MGRLVDHEHLEAGTLLDVVRVLEGVSGVGGGIRQLLVRVLASQTVHDPADRLEGGAELAALDLLADAPDVSLAEAGPVELDRLECAQRAIDLAVGGDGAVAVAVGELLDGVAQILPDVAADAPRAAGHACRALECGCAGVGLSHREAFRREVRGIMRMRWPRRVGALRCARVRRCRTVGSHSRMARFPDRTCENGGGPRKDLPRSSARITLGACGRR